jgi:hypothetical protein
VKKILCCCEFFLLIFSSLSGQNRYDVIIDEIMADPSPQVGLPNNEWLELKNMGTSTINLQNWRIGDASGQSGPLPSFLLKPDSVIILCSSSSLSSMVQFGAAISVTSFPSLDNDGDQLFLKNQAGRVIHGLNYSTDWYKNDLKKDGGWSLEMIDPHNPCGGASNWKASIDPRGGTPGKMNSINGTNTDVEAPQPLRSYCIDSLTVVLIINEPVDSLTAINPSNYSIEGAGIQGLMVIPPLFNTVQIKLTIPIHNSTVYQLHVKGLKDCIGNSMAQERIIRVGVPSEAEKGDWVINEVLFDPRPGGYDYVEFYNNSKKVLDGSRLFIANRGSNGGITNIKPLSLTPYNVYPGDLIVVTEDRLSLSRYYFVAYPENVWEITSLPSFPDDKGQVVALNSQGLAIDEVAYEDDWHFGLLNDNEGVSLERIDPQGPSSERSNWHSAASTAGYGTPTLKNSQYRGNDLTRSGVSLSKSIFSPDNDGIDDVLSIVYELEKGGYVANITIFNSLGLPVRKLVSNGTLGLRGSWNWDGLDDKRMRLPIGSYIIFTELFNLEGQKQFFKNAVVLARKLK